MPRLAPTFRIGAPARLLPWMAELASTGTGLIESYLPRRALSPRARERIILAVVTERGSRTAAWVHAGWQSFLGDAEQGDAETVMIDWARRCAQAGKPLPTTELQEVLPERAIRSLRASVARATLAGEVGLAHERLLERILGPLPFRPADVAAELAVIAVGLPWVLPTTVIGTAFGLLGRIAPPLPEVEIAPREDANLLTQMLGESAPLMFGNALVRLALLDLPVVLHVGVRSEQATSTISVGRRQIRVQDGIRSDVAAVLDGWLDPFIEAASGAITTEVSNLAARRST